MRTYPTSVRGHVLRNQQDKQYPLGWRNMLCILIVARQIVVINFYFHTESVLMYTAKLPRLQMK